MSAPSSPPSPEGGQPVPSGDDARAAGGPSRSSDTASAPTRDAAVLLRPVQTETARIIAFGTAVFGVALVVLAALRLADVPFALDHPTWLWTALAGSVLGLMGLTIVGRHRRLGRTR